KLFGFLKEIIYVLKGIIDGRHLKENKKEIILQIKKQLHLKNLCLILNLEEWKNIEENRKNKILKILFYEENEEKIKIIENLNIWERFKKQRDLGSINIRNTQSSLEEYGPITYLNPEYFQEINFEIKDPISSKLLQIIDGHSRDQEIAEKALRILKTQYSRWAQTNKFNKSKLIINGSVLLGINTINSDIDAIIVLDENEEINNKKDEINNCKFLLENLLKNKTTKCEKGKEEEKNKGIFDNSLFISLICTKKEIKKDEEKIKINIKDKRYEQVFGNEKVNCLIENRENCYDQSLFCFLCRERRVTDLKRITEAWINLIEFKIFGIDIDIAFVSLPDWPNNNNFEENSQEWLNYILSSQKNNALTKLQPISGYSSNKYLINLFDNNKNEKNYNKMPIVFCNALIAIKVWAKNNSIYGNINGFFNGAALTLLLAKVYILYPNSSTIGLIERFFLTFLTWNWPNPVRLKNAEKSQDVFSWTPQNELYARYKMLREIYIAGLKQGAISKAWERWIKGIKFTEKYEHFIVAVCATKIGNEHFCGYASTKLKLHLIWTIEEKNEFNQIEYCHISNLSKEGICNGETAKLLGNDSYCESKLIGMYLTGELNKSELEERFNNLSENIIKGYRLPRFIENKSGIAFKLIEKLGI
ncbi:PAP_central domain-containing protein, partial [Meloidogyne graminicola]